MYFAGEVGKQDEKNRTLKNIYDSFRSKLNDSIFNYTFECLGSAEVQ